MSKKDHSVVLERGAPDRLVPKDFFEVLLHRFLPVLGLTYVASVVGIAAKSGDFVYYIFLDPMAYSRALFVGFWVSIPAVLWIILKGSPMFCRAANDWYKISATVMSLLLFVSFLLLPEFNIYGLRTYFAATIPVFFVMYFFFVKGGLPPAASYPLTFTGLLFLFYGAALDVIH